ncbi:MAG: MarR family transcriptional regulator [Christensenellaceae bacterium]|nr:MarR family transcriptional regulator [Christensenellaceae bacterium]
MENDVCVRLAEYNSIFKENDDIYHAAAKKLGLSACALWLLYILREKDHVYTQSEICERLFMPKQTINSALKKLEIDGFIELQIGSDRKTKRVVLTESGRRLAGRSADKLLEAERSAFSRMTNEEQDAFLRLFRRFTDLLRDEAERII